MTGKVKGNGERKYLLQRMQVLPLINAEADH